MIAFAVIGVIAFVGAVMAAIGGKSHHVKSSQEGGHWRILYSPGMPAAPVAVGNGWWIDFPGAPNHVDYIMDMAPPQITYGQAVAISYTVSADGATAQELPDEQSTVTILIQRRGDDGSAQGVKANYRQYSTQYGPLTAGTHTLSVPITAETFGGVMGEHDEAALRDVLDNIDSVGVVFGSPSRRGHGVRADTPVRFTLTSASWLAP